ncbi:MAG: hypothetical protein V8R40_00885 [Dysosmobacter sp.]
MPTASGARILPGPFQWHVGLCPLGRQENKLFCARDRLGAKPLHYYHNANKLLLGSDQNSSVRTPPSGWTFNTPYLAANLMYRLGDYDDETLIEGMRALPPGTNWWCR